MISRLRGVEIRAGVVFALVDCGKVQHRSYESTPF